MQYLNINRVHYLVDHCGQRLYSVGVACRSAAEIGVNMFSVFLSQIVSGIHLLIILLACLAAHNGGL